MPAQLVSYDLITPGKDYSRLHDAIKSLGRTWWHCLESTWIIETDRRSGEIRDQLTRFIDQNDKLLVVGLNGNWASLHLDDNCNTWLRNNVAA